MAYKPEILILDEPTSGLDPIGKREVLNLILQLRKEQKIKTIIMISHNMDEIAAFTQRVIVLYDAKLIYDLTPSELFERAEELIEIGLDIPVTIQIKNKLLKKGVHLSTDALTVDELYHGIINSLGRKK